MFSNLRTGRLFRKGVQLVESGDYEAALLCFQEVARRDPKDAPAHNNIGFCCFRIGKHEEAVAAYLEAVRLAPDDPDYACDLGSVCLRKGQLKRAIRAYSRAARINPRHGPVYLGLGEALARQGRHAHAVEAFLRVIELEPECAEARVGAGLSYLELQLYDDALSALSDAVKLNPDDPTAYEGLARVHSALGQAKEALIAREETALRLPFSARAQYALAETYVEMQRWEKAGAAFERALRIEPNLRAAKVGLEEVRKRMASPLASAADERPPAKRPSLQTSSRPQAHLSVPDELPSAEGPGHSETASAFPKAPFPEPPDESSLSDERALFDMIPPNLSPPAESNVISEQKGHTDDLIEKGRQLYLNGRYGAALAAWEAAAREIHDDPVLHNNRAAALIELGRAKEAIAACRQALLVQPDYAIAHATLCEICVQCGDRETAARELGILRQLDPELAERVAHLLDP